MLGRGRGSTRPENAQSHHTSTRVIAFFGYDFIPSRALSSSPAGTSISLQRHYKYGGSSLNALIPRGLRLRTALLRREHAELRCQSTKCTNLTRLRLWPAFLRGEHAARLFPDRGDPVGATDRTARCLRLPQCTQGTVILSVYQVPETRPFPKSAAAQHVRFAALLL